MIFDPSQFNYTMPVICKAIINGITSGDERDLVLTYIDGELGTEPIE